MSRLGPGKYHCPQEEVELRLVFEPAGIAIALCLVLPESDMGAAQSELIIGDVDNKYVGVRDLIEAKKSIVPAGV